MSKKPARKRRTRKRPASKPSKRVVIEISGGVMQDVYSDIPGLQILLVDWDNINVGDTAGEVPYVGLSRMPEEAVRALTNVGLM